LKCIIEDRPGPLVVIHLVFFLHVLGLLRLLLLLLLLHIVLGGASGRLM
jgi:hypothetical protein